jgi:RimJ/RimL family protein N-acetyltransferase
MQALTTARLHLIPMELDRDLDDLHVMFGDPAVSGHSVSSASRSTADTRQRIEDEFGGNGGWTWVIRIRPSPRAVGVLGVFSGQCGPIRGLSWYLRRDAWGQGVMSEAARAMIDHLLRQPDVAGVEAWIDSRNTRSMGVARRAGLDLAGRLPRVYDDHEAQSVVMARASEPQDPKIIGLQPVLMVADLDRTLSLLIDLLGLQVRFRVGDDLVRLGLTAWSSGVGIDVRLGEGPPTTIGLDLGCAVDPVHRAVVDAGWAVPEPPQDRPWHRREFVIKLPEGHRLQLRGPLRPPTEDRRSEGFAPG